ncbi:DNA primase [Staphylococcus gallinarum]|uniref:DNA primase n=1 Tax=Staphylococcus gallinarum TaxID=1293 RepID=A0A380FII8_STAGA|nr:DNA primase [Staphylococcus gallinarum]
MLLQQGLNVFVVQLPKDMDPDEYIGKHGAEAFNYYVEHEKKAFVLYKVNLHQAEINNNDLAYERYLKEVTMDISYVKSVIQRKKILQEVSELFKVSMDSLINEVGHQQDNSQPPISPKYRHYLNLII